MRDLRILNKRDELLLGMHVELLVDMANMGLHGAVGKVQFALDERARAALGQKVQHLRLARGQAALGGHDFAGALKGILPGNTGAQASLMDCVRRSRYHTTKSVP